MTATTEPTAVAVGDQLPELVIHADPTFVISTALATRDFQDVHHDRDKAVERGSSDIFVNILTDTGLVQRFVTDWAGPTALVKSIALRLGVPLYAGDTLTLSGTVTAVSGALVTIDVRGRDSLGEHITATAVIALPSLEIS
ncbi:MaoC family dehydratase [Nocardia sp. NPDC051833]|uniref:MaoC family dehydratase n=1 Tax=Nocardia sp. NPDC051833 TaxID=3155674 RepID=UPI00343B673B